MTGGRGRCLTSTVFKNTVFYLVALTVTRQICAQSPEMSPAQAAKHLFGVRDSIEMSRFSRNDALISWSPDKKYIAFVTTRGIVESDEVESTLWVLRRTDITKILATGGTTAKIVPTIGARLKAIPKVLADDSYNPLITDERWTSDSKGLLFLGQTSNGYRRLFRVNLRSRVTRGLSSPNYDVSQFESRAGTIVYRATASREFATPGLAINRDAKDITGSPIGVILPLAVTGQGYVYGSELWTIRNRRNIPIRDPRTKEPVPLWNDPSPSLPDLNPLSISPDGRKVVVLTPCERVPRSWEAFEPFLAEHKIRFTNGAAIQGAGSFRLLQYVMVDLERGTTEPLIDAPNGWALGYTDGNLAIWSPGGGKLLLTDTYLPLDEEGATEREREARRQPCAAAVVDMSNKLSSCVAYSRGRTMSLQAARFGGTDQEVCFRFGRATAEECFHFGDGHWRSVSASYYEKQDGSLSDSSRPSLDSTEVFALEIRQDLNVPPALWVTDRRTRASKMIWDPNPGMAAISFGEASLFRWKDANGYAWTGGLVKPPDYIPGKRYPLVIQTHGFPEHEFVTDGAYTTAFAARALASHGIVVLQMADRFDDLVTAQEALNRALGFESAIDQLASEGLVDPKKVGIIGFSRTSYHVESALIKDPERFAAATIADGVDYSYMQYLLAAEYPMSIESEQIYGNSPFGEGLTEWTQRSPGFRLDRIQTPLRVEAIGAISLLAEREIYASLWKQEKPVDLIYFPGGQHILQKPLERMASQQGNVDWFCFWLLHQEDPDPAKEKQYARWRQLKVQSVARSAPR
jgi:hypothetical protein